MRGIVTVVGNDRVGIIAEVCTLLASMGVNILDINQTVMQGFFTMTMLVDIGNTETPFETIHSSLKKKGEDTGLAIRIQREDIFNAMYKV
ncbi:MAG: ACT domain-containing protein [Oscillospiraceae bacterium]|nr:ACT domain-containing protein [Oscillospiraceae bacterium]